MRNEYFFHADVSMFTGTDGLQEYGKYTGTTYRSDPFIEAASEIAGTWQAILNDQQRLWFDPPSGFWAGVVQNGSIIDMWIFIECGKEGNVFFADEATGHRLGNGNTGGRMMLRFVLQRMSVR